MSVLLAAHVAFVWFAQTGPIHLLMIVAHAMHTQFDSTAKRFAAQRAEMVLRPLPIQPRLHAGIVGMLVGMATQAIERIALPVTNEAFECVTGQMGDGMALQVIGILAVLLTLRALSMPLHMLSQHRFVLVRANA